MARIIYSQRQAPERYGQGMTAPMRAAYVAGALATLREVAAPIVPDDISQLSADVADYEQQRADRQQEVGALAVAAV